MIAINLPIGTYIGAAFALVFAMWWIGFPESVIPFYAWLGRKSIRPVKSAVIRLLGAIWAIVAIVVLFA
ncbi:MAG: hypothetical protein DME97_01255 [Verrucomicrobia bacterium]|nr:MAG: hypothetical protein DME97_01255 [Verrucomicrobiota bacterium]